jgi:multidrug efflux pump subunit AcrA (membrane-fusion protein)
MRVRTQLIRTGVITAAAGLALAGCSRPGTAKSAQTAASIPVTVAPIAIADIADTFEAGGVIQARTTAALTARILAPVREIRVAPGDRVRAGQVLIVLDGRDLDARVRRTRAAALAADQDVAAAVSDQQAADADLALARATHGRIANLHARRSATAQELDDATGALRTAEARISGAAARLQAAKASVQSARAATDETETTASFATLTAPFAGVVTEKMVEAGNMAAPGTPLLRVEDTRGFRLDVRVDESRIGQISQGAVVPVSLDSGRHDGATVTGTVAEISRAVDTDARAFLVKIALPDTPALRSGMFGRARFSGSARRALTVPARSLVRNGQVTSVFVVEKDVVRVRLVNVSGGEVLDGLSEGDLVVVAPPAELADGRRVSAGRR